MDIKKGVFLAILSILIIGSVFSIDYSIYRYENFTIPRNNPAYLVMPGGKASAYSLVKIEGNRWVVPVGPFWYCTLSQSFINKILSASNNNDNFILFYQRKGNYVDISKYTGTSNPSLIRRDTQGQIDFIEATIRAYSFIADDILTYSEIMQSVSREMQAILLNEENRSEENGGFKIFNAFVNGQMNGARNYVNNRIKAIEAENAIVQAERNVEAQRQAVEQQRREEERKAAENRAFTLETAMIIGYKPCFNIGASKNYSPYELHDKIAVVGYLENKYNNFGNEFKIMPINYNNDQRESLELIQNTNLSSLANLFSSIERIGSSGSMNSYYCIFFLSKTYEKGKILRGNALEEYDIPKYLLNSYIFLGDIISKAKNIAGRPDIRQNILEEWILNNFEKETIQFLNIITSVAVNSNTDRPQGTKPDSQLSVLQESNINSVCL